MHRFHSGITAFANPALISDPFVFDDEFSDWDSRRLRYNILWNFYQNTAYDTDLAYSQQYKTAKGLYRYIRNIYNPSRRIGDFWQSVIWGGKPLEFLTENSDIVEALTQVYLWSNWNANKDVVSLWGATLGDVGLRVRDDVNRERVYFEVIHPSAMKEIELDPFNNVKSYILEEERGHPDRPDDSVRYTETAIKDGENVIIETFLNGKLFPWNGFDSQIVEPYGFVPLVAVQHNNVGLDWGWSELHPGQSKFREIDDLASKLSDYLRITVNPAWLFAGITKPTDTPKASLTQPTDASKPENPFPGREEMPVFYGPIGADAKALVAGLDIAAVSAYIENLRMEIERDYPETRLDILAGTGELSGRALRIARQPVVTRVEQRRVGYYDALVRANKMALSIGGMRGYFPFNEESFKQGDLDHEIAKRPVFALDPMEIAEINTAEALAFKTEQEGLTWPTIFKWRRWLEAEGLNEEEIKETIAKALADAGQEDGFGFTEENV